MPDTAKADLKKALTHPRTRPWLAVAAEVPATLAAHTAWGDSPAAAVGLTLAAGALTCATWWAGQGTTPARRLHATLSTAAGTSYLVIATITDPLDPALLSTLAIGGAVAAGSWNVRQVLRVNPDTKQVEKGTADTGVLVKSIGAAKAALRSTPKVEPNKVTAPLKLDGTTTDALGNRIKDIAVELGVSPTSVRIVPDPDNAAHAQLVVVPQDMLKRPAPWPGPSRLGGSITDPVVIGQYEDGAEAVFWFPADPAGGRNATHFLTAGMNGSGKSAGQSVAITEALTRRDVIVWAVDPSKGQQTFAPFLPHLDWVEMTMSGGEAMIEALGRVITARADTLGRHGYKNWTPAAFDQLGMPYMVVWIEEAAKFFREGTEMEGLVMEARSAGISVIISLQRPSASSMPTDVREQLGGALVFGVKGSTTADMALPDDVRDAGARPEAWENRRPGYAYLVAPGVDEDRYATPLRTYLIDDDAIEGALALAPRPSADPVTAQAAGDAYAQRTRYDADSALTSSDTTAMQAAMALADGPEAAGCDPRTTAQEIPVEQDPDTVLEEKALRAVADAAGINTHDLPDTDDSQEIPPPTDTWTFNQQRQAETARRELTTEQAEAELLTILEEFRTQDRDLIGPKDFQPYWGKGSRLDRSRAWLSPRLADLAEAGIHLEETNEPGVYRLLHPELAPA